MRNMSFALTTAQIMEGTKTVTRRLGWLHARPGQQVRPVRKCMGLRPGERLDILRDPLTIVSVRREPLRAMTDDVDYGFLECQLEGFGPHPDYRWPSAFVAMFCATHRGCTPDTVVTRIEFAYSVEQAMPWYRVNGMPVHLKLGGKAAKNPPAPCAARTTPANPIVPSQRCCGISQYLCDFRLPSGGTCDMPLCAEHATQVGPDRHLCPRHVGAAPEAA